MSDNKTAGSDIMFNRIAKDLSAIKSQYGVAVDLISAMKEAGEDVTEVESTLRGLEIRQGKWTRMLEARGYKVE